MQISICVEPYLIRKANAVLYPNRAILVMQECKVVYEQRIAVNAGNHNDFDYSSSGILSALDFLEFSLPEITMTFTCVHVRGKKANHPEEGPGK